VSLPIGQHQALVIREGMVRPPEISVLGLPDHDPFGPRSVQTIFATFEQGAAFAQNLQSKTISWLGTDGVRIDGMFLSSAKADGPLPTVVEVHGGPVLADRARWIGHIRTAWLAFNGYGILRCNPRGSCGRGEAFAAALIGDVGGIDMADLLNGVDHLVAAGLADPARLAVTGCSYGGYMSAWLATQNSPFKAAIAISPITHWRSQHGTSQISRFDEIFIADHRQGEARSPVLAVTPSSVPSLLLAGMLDRNTPPSQAQEMHIALRDAGVDTELILYRDGGHSLRDLPIMLDTARRTHAWLVRCGCS
jgi:dipeptidyl aminopeptidase/acylaminoacyl peptidase